MSPLALPIAAVDPTLLEAIVAGALLVLAGVGKLLMKIQQNNQRAAGPRGPQQPIRANAADEINEFLQRAAKARNAERPQPARPAQARPVQARPAQARPVQARPLQARPAQIRPAQARPAVEKPVQAEVVADEPVGGKIGREVEKDLDTKEFTQRTTQLGSEVAQADKEIDEHLHQVFDHHVSKLELVPGEAATAPVAVAPIELTEQSLLDIPATFATGLTDLLADPDFVRQAIVLNEVLRRPEERW